jgi:hypothetical protein
MAKTLPIHFAVVTARSHGLVRPVFFGGAAAAVRQPSWFRHNPASSLSSTVLALIGSDDNAASCGKIARHIDVVG